jgi:hypothetical protein
MQNIVASSRYPGPDQTKRRMVLDSINEVVKFPQVTTPVDHNPIALRLHKLEIANDITEYTVMALMRHLTREEKMVAVLEVHTIPLLYNREPLIPGCRSDYCGRARLELDQYGATILSCAGIACTDPYAFALQELQTMTTAPEIMPELIPELRASLPPMVLTGNDHAFDHFLIASNARGIAFDGPRSRPR